MNPTTSTGQEGSAPPLHGSRRKPPPRRALAIAVAAVVMALVYFATLFGYWSLSGSSTELEVGPPELGNGSDTVVLVTLQSLRTVDYDVEAKILVVPADSLVDEKLDVLNQDIVVRLHPWNSLGDIRIPAGSAPTETATTIDVDGDVNAWPFDTYMTEEMSADLLIGRGDDRRIIPARVEVEGALQGWDLSSETVTSSPQATDSDSAVQITMSRALGPLAFDLGIVLVLLTLPALAMFTALLVITGRKQFQIAFATWYAAMLFAVVPLRNILPGVPPPGAWIDIALVLWVIVALVTATVMITISWYRQVH